MPQTDQVVANAPGLPIRTDIDTELRSLFSSSSGATSPAVVVPGQLWFDVSNPAVQRLAVRDQANAVWITVLLDKSDFPVGSTLAPGDTLEATGPNTYGKVTGGAVHRAGDSFSVTGTLTIKQADAGTNAVISALSIGPANGIPTINLNKPGAFANRIIGARGDADRWQIQVGDGIAETGSGNVGSNFMIYRAQDAGPAGYLDAPLMISRNQAQPSSRNGMQGLGYGQITPTTPGFGGMIAFRNTNLSQAAQIYYAPAAAYLYVQSLSGSAPYWGLSSVNQFVSWQAAYKPGGGNWGDSSDARIKVVEAPYSAGLAALEALEPVRYTFKGNDDFHPKKDGIEYIGLIAQAVEAVMPECITRQAGKLDGADVDDLRHLDSSAMFYALINAIKELSARIEALKAKKAAKAAAA